MDITAEGDHRVRILAMVPDWTGRELEVVAVTQEGHVILVLAMAAHPNIVRHDKEKVSDGAP